MSKYMIPEDYQSGYLYFRHSIQTALYAETSPDMKQNCKRKIRDRILVTPTHIDIGQLQ